VNKPITVFVDSDRATARVSGPLVLGDTYAVTFSGLTTDEAAGAPEMIVLGAKPGEIAARSGSTAVLAMTTKECAEAFPPPAIPPFPRPKEFPFPPEPPNAPLHGQARPHGSVRLHFYVVAGGQTLAQGDLPFLWAPFEYDGSGNPIVLKGDKGDKGEKGDKGDKGDPGRNGVYVAMDGLYAFHISQGGDHPEDGHLWIHAQDESTLYAKDQYGNYLEDSDGNRIPLYYINADGHLVYRFFYQDSTHTELDLGRVVTREGLYAFHVSDGTDGEPAGHLMLHGQDLSQLYAVDGQGNLILDENDQPIPLFELRNDGHLIFTFYGTDGQVHESLDIGDVRGPALTWSDLTQEQKDSLKGEKGDDGDKGDQGDPLTWEDLTDEQKAALKGDKGDPGEDGMSAEQIEALVRGTMGEADDAPTAGSQNWVTSGGLWSVEMAILARIAALKERMDNIRAALGGAFHFKGTVDTVADLPPTGNDQGDVYNVKQDATHSDGMNYAWTGTEWDALGGLGDLSAYALKTDLTAANVALANIANYSTVQEWIAMADTFLASMPSPSDILTQDYSGDICKGTNGTKLSTAPTINGKAVLLEGDVTQVQADWNEMDASSPAYINNKPTIPQQVQADWNQTTTTAPDYIKNKPALANVATSGLASDVSLTINGTATNVQTWASGADQFLGSLPSGSDILSQNSNGNIYKGSISTNELTVPPAINGDKLALAKSLAAEFDDNATYAVGDYCTHEGLLYKCSTAVSAAGDWNAANWTADSVFKNLPYDAELEYIELGNGAFIDSGVVAGGTDVFSYLHRLKIADVSQIASGASRITGAVRNSDYHYGLLKGNGNTNLVVMGGGSSGSDGVSIALTNIDGKFAIVKKELRAVYLDDTSKGNVSTSTTSSGKNYFIGKENGASSTPSFVVQFAECKLWTSGVLVRDLIPVRKNGVGYYYDKVSNTLLGAATGSTTIGLGPDKAQTLPLMDGTAAHGTSEEAAPIDHVHPNDTTREAVANKVTSFSNPTDTQYPSAKLVSDQLALKADAGAQNLLPYADASSGVALSHTTSVYRSAFASDGTFPTIIDTGIPTASAYFQFELELTVPSTVPSTITGPSGWTWMDGGSLPDPSDLSGGETLYIACRLDCTARTIKANCYEVA